MEQLPITRDTPGPVRTCVGCRQRATKSELLRVTVGSGADGQPAVVPDPAGVAPGRGAHLHPTTGCYELAVRRRAFARALRFAGHAPNGLSASPVAELLATLGRLNRNDQHEQRSVRHAAPSDRPPGNWST